MLAANRTSDLIGGGIVKNLQTGCIYIYWMLTQPSCSGESRQHVEHLGRCLLDVHLVVYAEVRASLCWQTRRFEIE